MSRGRLIEAASFRSDSNYIREDTMFSDKREVLERVKADNVKFVSLQFTDIVGTIKNVAIPVGRLEEVIEKGVWFEKALLASTRAIWF
jgi:hypothetical protein